MKINSIPIGSGAEAGYTLRNASDPALPYDGFNICHYTDDVPTHVEQCRADLCAQLGISDKNLITPLQTHSTRVIAINDDASTYPEGVDGLVTKRDDVALCINTADCVPVLFYDEYARVVGICHAGWRGVVNGVVQNTVNAMLALGADTYHIRAAMGPCICEECFEVGHEVAQAFAHWPEAVVERDEWCKPHVNLSAAITHILVDLQIDKQNILPPPECTLCSWQSLFSARRLGIRSGRILTYIRLLK